MERERIGVVGLGKLGMPLAAILGQLYKVTGIDKVSPKVPNEPHLDDLLDSADLRITKKYSELLGVDRVFCIVPTPSKEDGTFTDEYVRDAIAKAKPYMNEDGIFNVVSTVMPGTCRTLAEEFDMSVTYNPEFIALGNVVEGMINPDLVLIGGDNARDKSMIKQVYNNLFDYFDSKRQIAGQHRIPIKVMDTVSAELAKIALNTYITQKITFANVIGEVADSLGADAHAVLDAVGTDTRIGKKYFKPYGAYGGPCFPRDTVAFSQMAGDIPNFAEQTDVINKRVSKKYGYHDDRPEYQNV